MKTVKLSMFFIAVICLFVGCKKGEEGGSLDCEDNHTTKITYTNTGSTPLRVEVAVSLNAQFKPIAPVLVLDLAPGASVVREIKADQYFNVWSRDCSTTCTMTTYYRKTYDECSSYDEKQGI